MEYSINVLNENEIEVKISGRLDTNTVSEFEPELLKAVEEYSKAAFVFDLEELEYVSSVGLRLFLRIKKQIKDMKLINVSPEVYEIFDMTGFSRILDVQKRYREVSTDGCEIIGSGANGTVYRIDPETILKLYNKPDVMDEIIDERRHAKCALLMGIPTAISFDIVKSGDKYGTVFELLDAKSLVGTLGDENADIGKLAGEYVELLKEVHALTGNDVVDIEISRISDKFKTWAEFVESELNESECEILRAFTAKLPDNDSVLHGDCQPNNVMNTKDGLLFIDMDTLVLGDPVFELGFLYSTMIGYRLVDENDRLVKLDTKLCNEFWKVVFGLYYADKSDEEKEKIERTTHIISAVQVLRNCIKNRARRGEECLKRAADILKNELSQWA